MSGDDATDGLVTKMSEYWSTRWAEMRETMKTHPIEEFRSSDSGSLSRYIVRQAFGSGGPEEVVDFALNARCLDPVYCHDSLVGAPASVFYRAEVAVTADSAQHGVAVNGFAYLLPSAVRVLEVGAGYGPFAYALSKRASLSSYTFVDFEPPLSVQRYFVKEALPGLDAEFVTPDAFERDRERASFDLAVAMHCLGEMSADEAGRYLDVFTETVKPGGHLYIISWAHDSLRGPRKSECSRLSDYVPKLARDWRWVFRRPWPAIFDANPAEEWLLERTLSD